MIWSLATGKQNLFEFVDVSGTRWLALAFQVYMKNHENGCADRKKLTILSWWQGSERQASSVSAGKAALDPICTKISNQLWIQTTHKYIKKKTSGVSSKKKPCSFMCWLDLVIWDVPLVEFSSTKVADWFPKHINLGQDLTPRTALVKPQHTLTLTSQTVWQTAMAVSLCFRGMVNQ